MWHFLLYVLPWWAWAVLGILGLCLVAYVWRGIGWRNLAIIGAGVASVVFVGRARQKGYEDRKSEEEQAHAEQEKRFREIDSEPRDVPAAYDRLRRLQHNKTGR